MNKLQDKISDEALLKLIAQANKKAFSQLMSKHLGSLILYVMRYFPQRSDAEDIAQETFIRLWCKAPAWQDKGVSVKAWLYRVAYNLSIDQLRKQRLDYRPDSDENIVDESAFIERIMDTENNLAVQKIALDALPERQKTAIALCAIREFSNGEAATVMGISVDALESLLARGRRKLKKIYREIKQQQNTETGLADDIY